MPNLMRLRPNISLTDLVHFQHQSYLWLKNKLGTSQTFKLSRWFISANSSHVKLLRDRLSEHPFESLQRGLALCSQMRQTLFICVKGGYVTLALMWKGKRARAQQWATMSMLLKVYDLPKLILKRDSLPVSSSSSSYSSPSNSSLSESASSGSGCNAWQSHMAENMDSTAAHRRV